MIILILISFILLFTGLIGIIFNRKNMIMILINLELILLSSNLNFLIFSLYLDNITGLIVSLVILTISAAETSLGLSIIISYYKYF